VSASQSAFRADYGMTYGMGGDGSRRADADDPRLSDALHLLASLDLPGTCDT
jgi:hypothetical protein